MIFVKWPRSEREPRTINGHREFLEYLDSNDIERPPAREMALVRQAAREALTLYVELCPYAQDVLDRRRLMIDTDPANLLNRYYEACQDI